MDIGELYDALQNKVRYGQPVPDDMTPEKALRQGIEVIILDKAAEENIHNTLALCAKKERNINSMSERFKSQIRNKASTFFAY